MTLAFILRFEEACNEFEQGVGTTGTETRTKQSQEQADADPTATSYHAIPIGAMNSGTATHTRQQKEQADADYGLLGRGDPMRPLMATQTGTAVQREQDDRDPRQQALTAIPR